VTGEGVDRRPPGRIGRVFMRSPIVLYRLGLGWVLGRRFVLVEHVGRKSGLTRRTVLEVIDHDPAGLAVAAAWGPRSDWFQNVQANPDVRVSTGRLRNIAGRARVLSRAEAEEVFARYADAHPRAASALSKVLDVPVADPSVMAEVVPVVRFDLAR
jgi:deazaflavin-dependent oxidoreductase (nitroreductase family)